MVRLVSALVAVATTALPVHGFSSFKLPSLPTPFAKSAESAAAAVRADALRLEELVVMQWDGRGGADDDDEIDALIGSLAAANVKFSGLEERLFIACYSRPAEGDQKPRWQRQAELLKPFGVRNAAGQDYDVARQRVTNYGEILGSTAYFSARGGYAENDASVTSW